MPLGQFMHGMVNGKGEQYLSRNSFSSRTGTALVTSYVLERSRNTFSRSSDVILSLEVCYGDVQLFTAKRVKKPSSWNEAPELTTTRQIKGGFENLKMKFREARYLSLASSGLGEFVLLAEDPAKRVWLEATVRLFQVRARSVDNSVLVKWEPASLFGWKSGKSAGAVEYEVFYFEVPGHTEEDNFNMSTPCGLYEAEARRKAKRKLVKTETEVVIAGLKPNKAYVFNVVAKSVRTGHSLAYEPSQNFMYSTAAAFAEISSYVADTAPSRSTFWDDEVPTVIVFILLLSCCVWMRRNGSAENIMEMAKEIELPSLPSFGRQRGGAARNYTPVVSGGGSYAPPSMMGIGR